MIVALASPKVASSLDEGLDKTRWLLKEAAVRKADIVCFPEAYLPGLRGQDFDVAPFGEADRARVINTVSEWTRTFGIAAIVGMEWPTEAGRQIASVVIDRHGDQIGVQTKNQLDPSEEAAYVPGTGRRLFEIKGVTFGIAICHEGFRYPETVRWAAARGAAIVFHPQMTGRHDQGPRLTTWGASDAPYYEKAMMMRGLENTIYFASVNYALPFAESATSLITPSGACQAHLPYGHEGVLVESIDVAHATGLLAKRYAPERNHEVDESAAE